MLLEIIGSRSYGNMPFADLLHFAAARGELSKVATGVSARTGTEGAFTTYLGGVIAEVGLSGLMRLEIYLQACGLKSQVFGVLTYGIYVGEHYVT